LRPERRPDSNELEIVGKPGEPDVAGRISQVGAAESALAFVDDFPALLDRDEVPPRTAGTHGPYTCLLGIERHASSDRKGLEDLVPAERRVAEGAGAVHGSV